MAKKQTQKQQRRQLKAKKPKPAGQKTKPARPSKERTGRGTPPGGRGFKGRTPPQNGPAHLPTENLLHKAGMLTLERGPHGWCVVRSGKFVGNIPHRVSHDELQHRLSRLDIPSPTGKEMRALLDCNEIGSRWEVCAASLIQHALLLWEGAHRLATEAKNVNIKHEAARFLGRIYREVSQRNRDPDGKKRRDAVWERLLECDEFKRERFPFGADGGQIPASDLRRWVDLAMDCEVRHVWSDVVWVAQDAQADAKPGEVGSLEWVWETKRARLDPKDNFYASDRAMCDHPFSRLPLAGLSDFHQFWEAALKSVLKARWKEDRKTKKLRVSGDLNFDHRCNAVRTVAEDYFERFMKPILDDQRRLPTDAEWKAFLEG